MNKSSSELYLAICFSESIGLHQTKERNRNNDKY